MLNYDLTLTQAEAEYDVRCQRLSNLNLELDAHAHAVTHYRRLAGEKPARAQDHPDLEAAEAHSQRHLETFNAIAALKKELAEWKRYTTYLKEGGEVGNPYWDER